MQHYLQGILYPTRPSVRGIMFGTDMDTAELLMKSTGGYKRNLFMLDTTLENFHYIPNTESGSILLKIISSSALHKQLNTLLLSDMCPRENAAFDYDALDANGEPVLLAYDFDMLRINKFNTALNVFDKTGIIVCFDFQQPTLQRIMNSNVSFSSIDFHKFKRRFFHET